MKSTKSCLFVLLLFCSAIAFAQKDLLGNADNAFSNGKYEDAIELYKKAYVELKPNKELHMKQIKAIKATILFKIGECYRMLKLPILEIDWYGKAMHAHCADSAKAAQYLQEAQKQVGNYDTKPEEYKNYQKQTPLNTNTDTTIHK